MQLFLKDDNKQTKKNFGLTEPTFQNMIHQLKSGDQTLFQHIFLAHFQDCMAFLQRKFGATHDDAYDATMETLVVFRNRLLLGKVSYGNMRFLFTQMACQIYLRLNQKNDQNDDLSDFENQITDELKTGNNWEFLHKAWQAMCQNCKMLLKQHYFLEMPLKSIAQEEDRTEVAIRKQKQRCISKLRKILAGEQPD